MERLQSIYNTGNNSNDPLNVSIKEDIFKEIELALKISLDEVNFMGEINEQWNETIGHRDTDIESSANKKTKDNTKNINNQTDDNTNKERRLGKTYYKNRVSPKR